jgi:hypothetical protein
MGTFTIEAPDGKSYTIEGDNAEGALAALKKHLGDSAAPAVDKYRQAAIEDNAKLNEAGAPSTQGLTRRLIHGATFGADTTLSALATTPAEMIRHGTFDPTEGYAYAKAREDLNLDEARKNTGALGTAAEVLGGGLSGAGLAKAGITAAHFLAPESGLAARSLASAADAAALGGFSGGMEGNGVKERFNNALKGAAVGGVVGGAAPAVMTGLGAAASPVVSNIRARLNPQGFAESQVARAIHEGNINPDDLALNVIQAGNEGQGTYTLADALGNPGQRMLSTVARAPGEGRTAVVDALEARQAGQGRRVANTLAEGFNTPQTAAQAREAMTNARDTAANAEYGAVRANGGQVDVVPTLNHLDQNIGTGPGQALVMPNDSIETVLRGFRERVARVNPDDFAAVQRIRSDMADAAQSAAQGGHGNRARMIRNAVGELDRAMEAASPGYRQANANFRQASQDIEAIDQGRVAAMRGRPEDTIPVFQNLPQRGQQAFRTGYADPLIEQAQSAAVGTNKSRPLTNDAFREEAAAIAPGNDMMQRRLGREMTMFETRNHALGGSRTADNLNDHAAMAVDPHLVGQVVTGNWHGALRTALAAGHNAISGNTPAVRHEVANILLQNGQNISAANLRRMVNETVSRIQFVNNIARNVGRGAAGGLAIAAPSAYRNR